MQINIFLLGAKWLVSRTYDLISSDKLFHTVCTPADNTCHCKKRCKQLLWDAKHTINKAAVEVHICADTFVDCAAL